ncbi:MAG: TIGR00266 family protein [Leptospiraceae bacterium]|nr:TIGR00266 family protein [Leptospiraceae bacterium]MCB1322526.1 TIGR00266 family protein [Leptospiraceae bacterium]
MEVKIEHSPGNATARLALSAGETVTAEAGVMIAMSGNINIETTTHKKGQGGVLKALKRMLSGESFFLNHFTANGGPGEVVVAPTLAGDLMSYELKGETLVVQSGSFLASEHSVNMDMGWQGFKSMFSGESMFWLKMSGSGKIVLSSFGAIYPIEVDGAVIVDTGHIVAFHESLKFSIKKAGTSLIGSFLGGEGLVTRFEGKGTVWCQSHNAGNFGSSLTPHLRPRQG